MISAGGSSGRVWIPVGTLLIALVLLVLPLQEVMRGFAPDWVSLALIYWALAVPGRMGIPVAWGAGLIVDIVTMGVPGAHAFSKALLVAIAGALALRIRVFPVWQQSVVVIVLLGIELISLIAIGYIAGESIAGIHRWTAVVVGGLLWPLVYQGLRRVRHLEIGRAHV